MSDEEAKKLWREYYDSLRNERDHHRKKIDEIKGRIAEDGPPRSKKDALAIESLTDQLRWHYAQLGPIRPGEDVSSLRGSNFRPYRVAIYYQKPQGNRPGRRDEADEIRQRLVDVGHRSFVGSFTSEDISDDIPKGKRVKGLTYVAATDKTAEFMSDLQGLLYSMLPEDRKNLVENRPGLGL
jgi:hypothetical protein